VKQINFKFDRIVVIGPHTNSGRVVVIVQCLCTWTMDMFSGLELGRCLTNKCSIVLYCIVWHPFLHRCGCYRVDWNDSLVSTIYAVVAARRCILRRSCYSSVSVLFFVYSDLRFSIWKVVFTILVRIRSNSWPSQLGNMTILWQSPIWYRSTFYILHI